MRNLLRLCVVALCLVVVSPAARKSVSDEQIVDQVRMKLVTDVDVKGYGIDVVSKDGVVTIKGRVDSERGKNRAGHLAKRVKGVKQVDNQITVGPPN